MSATMAAVDIGTNSVKMTIAERAEDGSRPLRLLADRTNITRLGKGVDAAGRLTDEAMQRTLSALEAFAQEAKIRGAGRIAAVGTSALRDAANGAEFVARAQEVLGGTVEVISGAREAELIYTAAHQDPDLPLPDDPNTLLATMDIGGGSTEVVLGRDGAVLYRESLQLGAVRLTERTLPSDPPPPAERAQADAEADAVLSQVPVLTRPGETLVVVGSGGTAANLANMECSEGRPTGSPPLTLEELHGTRLTRGQIERRINLLAAVPLAERRLTPGLEPERADVILAGAIIQARALLRLGAPEVIVSLRGLRYGLLYEMFR